MRTFLKLLSIGLLISLCSCTSTKTISKVFNSKAYSLAYLKDSQVRGIKKDVSVSIDTIYYDDQLMCDSAIITKDKGFFLPLVCIYYWQSLHTCTQGQRMIEEDASSFLFNSLADEIDRSACFSNNLPQTSDYSLVLSIDEISASGAYKSSGFFYFFLYFYGFSYGDVAGPALSRLSISYRLKKGDDVVLSHSYYAETPTNQLNVNQGDVDGLLRNYANSMVEATSFNFKKIIEDIVNDVNYYVLDNY